MKKNRYILLFTCLLLTGGVKSQFVVNPGGNLNQMVTNFILTGVSAFNIAYTGDSSAVGSFSGGASTNLGLTDGIILTTGNLDSLPAINSPATDFSNTNNNHGGDALLTSIVNWPTYDAAVLEFDLVPVGNILEFQYVFASEEYPEYVGSNFNDVFGFYISGADPNGGSYTNANIALIPGSNQAVCVNNINATSNSSYFVDNLGQGGTNIVFDGFTTVLIAHANVVAGSTYHLKMAIADVADNIFDAAIFLKAQSMKSYTITGQDEKSLSTPIIYPNPISGNSMIYFSNPTNEMYTIAISDLKGSIILSTEISVPAFGQIALYPYIQKLGQGVYFLKIAGNKDQRVEKIVINN